MTCSKVAHVVELYVKSKKKWNYMKREKGTPRTYISSLQHVIHGTKASDVYFGAIGKKKKKLINKLHILLFKLQF